MYVLYGGKFTRALMVEMVMAEGGIAYELRNVDIPKREHRSPEFLKINPAGWIPVLITPEGDRLYETAAINLYLAERHGLAALAPETGDPARGPFLSALFYLTNHLEPALKRYWYPHRYGAGEPDAPAVKAKAYEHALECLAVIDARLAADGPFHLGERFSLADLTMAYWTESLAEAERLENLPAVRRCAARVVARPKLKPLFDRLVQWRPEIRALRAGGGVR